MDTGLIRGMRSDSFMYSGGNMLSTFNLAEFIQSDNVIDGSVTEGSSGEYFFTEDY